MKNIISLMIMFASIGYSQTVYEIPFASKGNEIELAVFNDSEIDIESLRVSSVEQPSWIKYAEEEIEIKILRPKKEGRVAFKFEVEQLAEVLTEETLKFKISGNNQTWEKEIKITVLPPDRFELN